MIRKVYLDNCCFNRPYDDQSQETVRLETESKLYIQEAVLLGKLHLVWSFILELENNANPFDDRRENIAHWRDQAIQYIGTKAEILEQAKTLNLELGIKPKDALHIASAVAADCQFFITTDRELVRKKKIQQTRIMSPIDFLFIMENTDEE